MLPEADTIPNLLFQELETMYADEDVPVSVDFEQIPIMAIEPKASAE